jgi:hypothetical protein
MKMYQWWLCVGLAVAAVPASAETSGCGLPKITGAGELNHFLGLRAVEVVKRSASLDDGLSGLVAPSASFNFGSGDVGRMLGVGVDGARELTRAMKADTYRFLGWDYMNMPVDACTKHEVEVEFIDSRGKNVSRVKFTFQAGRVVSADGWIRSFETGPL